MKPTALQTTLATLAPSVALETIWEHDESPELFIVKPGSGALAGEDPDDWQAWQSEVRAIAIIGGRTITGSAYLGSTWEKYGDNPWDSNPGISGYELQVTREALEELQKQLPDTPDAHNLRDVGLAVLLDYLKAEAGRRYDEQRGNVAPATV